MAFFCLLFLFFGQKWHWGLKEVVCHQLAFQYSKATHVVDRFSLCYVYVAAESLKLFERAEKIGYIFLVSQKYANFYTIGCMGNFNDDSHIS